MFSPHALRLTTDPSGRSYLGGSPGPLDLWPTRGKKNRPLDFLACIDLEDAQKGPDQLEWLPKSGSLLFFYDHADRPWGISSKDRDGWAVKWIPLRVPPDRSAPDSRVDVSLSVVTVDVEVDETCHQLGGRPSPIQEEDMAADCQAMILRAYPGIKRGISKEERRAAIDDWRLLLQIDTDARLEWMWGDMGRLYFWIRESDARQGDFSKVWCILQCS